MHKKIIKDIFIRDKESESLQEELKTMEKTKKSLMFKFLIITVAAVIIASAGFVMLNKVSLATVEITPYQEIVEIDSRIIAVGSSDKGYDGLVFETVNADADDTKTIVATGFSADGEKANGKITVYNKYSSNSLRLIANTRFETPEGKIYRIKNPVTVPGMGSVEVTVYADGAGSAYNIGLTDFTIPGLKDTPMYKDIYARSKTEITGGSDGNTRIVKSDDIEKARAEAKTSVNRALASVLMSKKPEGYVFLNDAMKIDYVESSNNPKAGSGSDKATFKIKGLAAGFLFNNESLSNELVEDNKRSSRKPIGDSGDVYIANLEDLEFKVLSYDETDGKLRFSVKGDALVVWNVDEDMVKSDLTKAKKNNYNDIFQKYANIEKANIILSPSWWKKIPKDKNHIEIKRIIGGVDNSNGSASIDE